MKSTISIHVDDNPERPQTMSLTVTTDLAGHSFFSDRPAAWRKVENAIRTMLTTARDLPKEDTDAAL